MLVLGSETINNFMLYAFVFSIVFGYWVYRLISKFVDHVIHTQQTDQYARHFADHSHLFSSFGEAVSNLVSTIESHTYIYSMCTYLTGTVCNACSFALSPVMNYLNNTNQNSAVTSVANPLVGAICNYLKQSDNKKLSRSKPKKSSRFNYDRYCRIKKKCPVGANIRVCPTSNMECPSDSSYLYRTGYPYDMKCPLDNMQCPSDYKKFSVDNMGCPPDCPYFNPTGCPDIDLSNYYCLPTDKLKWPSATCPFTCPPADKLNCPPTCPSTCPSDYLSTCLPTCPSACPSTSCPSTSCLPTDPYEFMTTDLKKEFNNYPLLNKFVDSIIQKCMTYDWTDQTKMVSNYLDFCTMILNINESEKKLLETELELYMADANAPSHPLRDLLCMSKNIKTGGGFDFNGTYDLCQQLVARWSNQSSESVSSTDAIRMMRPLVSSLSSLGDLSKIFPGFDVNFLSQLSKPIVQI